MVLKSGAGRIKLKKIAERSRVHFNGFCQSIIMRIRNRIDIKGYVVRRMVTGKEMNLLTLHHP